MPSLLSLQAPHPRIPLFEATQNRDSSVKVFDFFDMVDFRRFSLYRKILKFGSNETFGCEFIYKATPVRKKTNKSAKILMKTNEKVIVLYSSSQIFISIPLIFFRKGFLWIFFSEWPGSYNPFFFPAWFYCHWSASEYSIITTTLIIYITNIEYVLFTSITRFPDYLFCHSFFCLCVLSCRVQPIRYFFTHPFYIHPINYLMLIIF